MVSNAVPVKISAALRRMIDAAAGIETRVISTKTANRKFSGYQRQSHQLRTIQEASTIATPV